VRCGHCCRRSHSYTAHRRRRTAGVQPKLSVASPRVLAQPVAGRGCGVLQLAATVCHMVVHDVGAMFGMLGLVVINTKMIRSSIPPLVPFIGRAVGYSSLQQASLLSSFFPGYLLTQVPAGWLAQRFGAKLIVTLNMVGTAALFSALPLATRSSAGSPMPAAALLTAMGLCQGGLIPAEAAIKREWLVGMEASRRAWLQGILGFAHQLCHLLATWATPRLASSARGWPLVCAVYGSSAAAAAVLWQLFASNQPPPRPGPSAASTGSTPAPGGKASKTVGVEWGVFRTGSVLGIMSCQMAYYPPASQLSRSELRID
jgi:hypothetical protein